MTQALSKKDFESNQEVRWCPGCGDYSILATVQRFLPSLGIPRENHVFISGIGCSSRFPYYMETYGFHTIHGRAPAIASGLKIARPELTVWMITGDGDALSIGGNHFIHLLRRNLNINVLLFNNQIYGLTKGQYSPTSEIGKRTKSTPYGSLDEPMNPASLALGAKATFYGRASAVDAKNLTGVLQAAVEHKGTSLIEIFQNCNVFNDGAFEAFDARSVRSEKQVQLVHGEPMLFGQENELALHFDGFTPKVVRLSDVSVETLTRFDRHNIGMAQAIARLSFPEFPVPMGVLYSEQRSCYEDSLHEQMQATTKKLGAGSLEKLLQSGDTWQV